MELQRTNETLLVSDDYNTVTIEGLDNVNIIFADDLEMNRILVDKQFKARGFSPTISTAENGKEVLKLYNSGTYDIILTDIRMPDVDGMELTKKIRAKDSEIKIVGISANAAQKDIDYCLEIGMNQYLIKPYNFNDLLIAIAKQLSLPYRVSGNKYAIPPADKKAFKRLKEISDNEEDYQEMVKNMQRDIQTGLKKLKEDPINTEFAHSLVNNIAYMENENLLTLSKELEEHTRVKNAKLALKLIKKIEEIVDQVI